MKTIRLLLTGALLAATSLVVNAQNYLPQKNAFSVGGGFMWGMSEGKGDFQDVAGTPTCGNFGLEYRHYPIPNIGLGVAYNHLWGNKDGYMLRCNFIAPEVAARWLWAENKQGFWVNVGMGYLKYKDDLLRYGSFEKGYFAMSCNFGYEFAIGKGVGMQLRLDMIMADFKDNGYRTYYGDSFSDNMESTLNYISLGVALVFGK